MFLSLQIGFSFANAVAVCADLARISVLDPSSLMMAPRYLNCFTVSSSCPLAVMHDLIELLLFVIILVFSALISIPYLADVSTSHFVTSVEQLKSGANCLTPDGDTFQLSHTSQITIMDPAD